MAQRFWWTSLVVAAAASVAGAATIGNGPWVAHVDRTSVVLAWDTDVASSTVVNYGLTQAYGSQIVGAPGVMSTSGWATHTVTITGLQSDTRYYYQAVSDNASSPAGDARYWFRTAVDENTPYRFASIADSRGDSSALELAFGLPANFHEIVDRIRTLNPPARFVLFSGDPVYGDDDPAVLRQEWDLWKAATQEIHRNMPIYMSPGNHESYHAGAEDMFRDVWEQPKNGGLTPFPSLPWNLDELAYSFDHGVVHFVSYDTNIDGDPLTYNAPPEQTNWLAQDLPTAVPMHRIVFSHTEGANPCPLGLGASLEETSQANYLDLYTVMSGNDVGAYVCGHIHNWVGDLGIMGVREVMNGTCGSISSTAFCGVVADHYVVWDVACGTIQGNVYDQDGGAVTGRGAPFSVTALNKARPEAALLSPTTGTVVCGTITLDVAASAHNCETIDRVEFFVDGGLVGVVTTAPWQMSWDSTSVPNGSHAIHARAYDTTGAAGLFRDTPPATVTVDNSQPCSGYPANVLTGPGAGQPNPNTASIFNASGALRASWAAYGTGRWGTRVAGGDLDADDVDEALTGPGPGDVFGPHVRAFRRDGTTVAKVNFFAYGTLKYGVNPSTSLLDADAFREILTTPGPGAVFGPHVRGFNYDAATVAAMAKVSFYAYNTLRYGANVHGGNVDGDAFGEILTGPGPGPVFRPQARGFDYDGTAVAAIGGINAFLFATTSDGLVIASGDLDGDAFEEIVGAKGPNAAFDAQVRAFDYDGASLQAMAGVDFLAYTGATAGARVDAGDFDNDGFEEIVVGPGPAAASAASVKGYNVDGGPATPMPATSFTAYGGLGYGTHVASIEANLP